MKYQKYLLVVAFVLSFVFMFASCSDSDENIAEKNKNVVSPSETVKDFFQNERKVNEDDIAKLIRAYPESYVECLFNTLEQCKEKRIKDAQKPKRNSNSEDVLTIDRNEEPNIIVKGMSNAVINNKVKLDSISSEWTNGNEARVRTNINSNGTHITRDILLYKENDDWKIFAFVDVDDSEYFAPPI